MGNVARYTVWKEGYASKSVESLRKLLEDLGARILRTSETSEMGESAVVVMDREAIDKLREIRPDLSIERDVAHKIS